MKTDIIELICESFSTGIIEEDAADTYTEFVRSADLDDMEDVELLEEMVNSLISENIYIMEKKTREQYRRDKFKKKYNYIPNKVGAFSDNYGGTITDPVSGKKFRVNIGNSNLITDEYGDKRLREMDTDTDDNEITVDKTYWKIPARRSESILNHEIGHVLLHGNSADAKKFRQSNERKENGKILSRFSTGGHNNIQEFEADRYAAGISGKKNLIRGLRQATKIDSSSKNLKKEARSWNDAVRHNEYKDGKEWGDSDAKIEDVIKRKIIMPTKSNIAKVRKNRFKNNDMIPRTRALNSSLKNPNIYK